MRTRLGRARRAALVAAVVSAACYKQVYIRRMPIEGGAPRVVAYVYGGQGTLNVPSWSPDGTMLAFVSNTDME
jgi:Tol biopolymer transport system component